MYMYTEYIAMLLWAIIYLSYTDVHVHVYIIIVHTTVYHWYTTN